MPNTDTAILIGSKVENEVLSALNQKDTQLILSEQKVANLTEEVRTVHAAYDALKIKYDALAGGGPTTPPPPPPPPPAPTAGYIKPFTLQRMEQSGGYWTSKPNWYVRVGDEVTIAAARFELPGIDYRDEITIEAEVAMRAQLSGFKDSQNRDITNLKWFRMNSEGKLNTYEGQPGAGSAFLHTEYIKYLKRDADSSAWNDAHRHFDMAVIAKMFDGNPHTYIRFMKMPTGIGKNDGVYRVTMDGKIVLEDTMFQLDDAANPGCPKVFNLQLNPSNHNQPATSFIKIKDSVRLTVVKK